MNITTFMDIQKLEQLIKQGFISRRSHPHLPLWVLNYTPMAQYSNCWNNETLHCRGLVIDGSGEVVSNCMKKFFNYGEPLAPKDTSGPVQVTDKADGSMITVSFYYKKLIVATRGSFESEQAIYAYNLITEKYLSAFQTICGEDSTAVAEIIYPENRIVVDYGDMRDVVLIGVISNEELSNGRQLWTPANQIYSWPGPTVNQFDVSTFEEALRLPPRSNAEGIVVYFENSGERLKIKQEDYVRLHRIFFSYSPKRLVETILEGRNPVEYISELPDELYNQATQDFNILNENFRALKAKIVADFESNYDKDRRSFADKVKDLPHRSALFALYDSRSIDEYLWKQVKNLL